MGTVLNGEQQIRLLRKINELSRQVFSKEYPYDAEALDKHLQAAVEGRFAKPKWTEDNGIITFTLPKTEGIGGEAWITRLEVKGVQLGDSAKHVLRSADFRPTTGEVHVVKILKGDRIFDIEGRITKNIRSYAKELRLRNLNAEDACLIREKFTNEELQAMGLKWIEIMHEPIKNHEGDLDLLVVDGSNFPCLHGCSGILEARWGCNNGFAFQGVV